MRIFPPQQRERANEEPLVRDYYLLALTYFRRRVGASGIAYLWASFRVIAGPQEGRQFWCGVSINLTRQSAKKRWEAWSEAVDLEEPVDLEHDDEIMACFRGQPFKALVRVEQLNNGMRVNDIEYVCFKRQMSAQDRAICDEFRRQWSDGNGNEQEPGWYPGEADDGPIDPYLSRDDD